MNLRWLIVSSVIGSSFWIGCTAPVSSSDDDWMPIPEMIPSKVAEAETPVELPTAESPPAVEAPEEPVAESDGPAVAAKEAPEEPGLIPQFKAERPQRLAMPVPVFPEGVDFDVVFPGWVDFLVQIDAVGTVIETEVLASSDPRLEGPAETALQAATYTVVRDPRGVPLMVSFRDRVEF